MKYVFTQSERGSVGVVRSLAALRRALSTDPLFNGPISVVGFRDSTDADFIADILFSESVEDEGRNLGGGGLPLVRLFETVRRHGVKPDFYAQGHSAVLYKHLESLKRS